MDKYDILEVLDNELPDTTENKEMIIVICQESSPEQISKEELMAGVKSIRMLFLASDPGYETVSHAAQSPFDGKWYDFSYSNLSGSFIPEPTVHDQRPPWFEPGNEGRYPYR